MANKPFGKYAYHITLVLSFSEKESGEVKALASLEAKDCTSSQGLLLLKPP